MHYAPLLYLAQSMIAISAGIAVAKADEPAAADAAAADAAAAKPSPVYSTATSTEAPVTSTTPVNPQCTWDTVQFLDPESWTPKSTYEYQTYSGPPVGPGAIDPDILAMVQTLTTKEKIGQMTQIQVGNIADCNGNLNETAVNFFIDEWKVGSFLESPGNHGGKYNWYSPKQFADFTDAVQKIALSKGSKIPMIWGLDSVRGANYVKGGTMFPSGTGTAATFNPSAAYNAGRIAAKDSRSAGAHWAFGPVLDLSVNKIWSRTYENFGEDPYLSSRMAEQSVLGYQGDYKNDRTRVATSIKHFIAYGNPFDGSDRGDRRIAAHDLLEYYVPPFQAAVNAGAATVMEAYSAINSEAVALSDYYLGRLLRDQMGFKGMMVTDWAEINNQALMYFTAKDVKEANQLALQHTTIDMSMVPYDETFSKFALELVNEGIIPISRIDESVARVLQLKKDLGLFEQPYADRSLGETVGSPQDVEVARDAVRESVTLLKNDNHVLPLKKSENVLFVGPTLNTTRFMGGGWNLHWQGPTDAEGDAVYQGFGDTILKGVEQVTGSKPTYFLGTDIHGENYTDVKEILKAVKKADKIVIGLGEHSYAEEVGNIYNMTLPAKQLDLVNQIRAASDKPIVVVLVEGRPRGLGNIPKIADSIIDAYLPGAYGGLPIAEILYGKVNPSGRLPITYPATEAATSDTIWQPAYMAYNPQWAFGYGLGYSDISYSNVTLSSPAVTFGAPVTVSVTVTNNGPYPQKEPVLLFTHQQYRRIYVPELFRLRNFQKVDLAVGETKTVSFTLTAEELAFWDKKLNRRIDPAPVNVAINPFTQKNIVGVVDLQGDPTHILATGASYA
ncbi:hypothetical protein GGI07_001526 [Coemansia sp. Benny D115]|nr:hypothetical protein GGI07_001526 [Coemansia sp. Benny D115]